MPRDTYEIMSGVHRSKAYQLAGRTTISAQVFSPDGRSLGIRDLDIDQLLSPKDTLDLTQNVHRKIQFHQMESAAAQGAVSTIIEVIKGHRGTPIRNVKVIR